MNETNQPREPGVITPPPTPMFAVDIPPPTKVDLESGRSIPSPSSTDAKAKESFWSKLCCNRKRKEKDPDGGHKVPFLQLFRFATKRDTVMMWIGSISSFMIGLAFPACNLIFAELLNDMAKKTQQEVASSVGKWAGYMALVGVAAWVFSWLGVTLWIITGSRQIRRMRCELFAAILRQEVGWFDVHKTGELASRVAADTTLVEKAVSERIGNMVQYFSVFIWSFVYGFWKSWRLTLIMCTVVPVIGVCAMMFQKVVESTTVRGQQAYASAGAIAYEVISSIRTVHAFNGMDKESARYRGKLGDACKVGVKKGLVAGVSYGLTMAVMYFAYALAFWYGSYLVEWGYNNGGEIAAVFFSILTGAFTLGQAAPIITTIGTACGAAYKLFAIVDRTPAMADASAPGTGRRLDSLEGHIRFNGVGFTYPAREDTRIFNDFSLDIPPSHMIALVGPSGCGKSSVVALIERYYDPDAGSVTVDGVDLRDLDLYWWRQQVGIVTQEPVLFATTIMENIKCANPEATDDQVMAACRDAYIHDTIMQLPQGYNTYVGEIGSQLSGGQKQRVAIARAIIKNPKVLLLDEATSALDRRSEMEVQRALLNVMRGRTVLAIAHRLATVADAYRLYYIERTDHHGAVDPNELVHSIVAESGSHPELMALKGKYYNLVRSQLRTKTGAVLKSPDLAAAFANEASPPSALSLSEPTSGGSGGGKSRAYAQNPPAPLHPVESGVQMGGGGEGSPLGPASPYALPMGSPLSEHASEPTSEGLTRGASSSFMLATQDDTAVAVTPAAADDKKNDEKAPIMRIAKLNRPELVWIIFGLIGATMAGVVYPVNAVLFAEFLNVFYKPIPEMRDGVPLFAWLFVALGVFQFVALSIKYFCLSLAGERLTKRMRDILFQRIIRQEIAFFDHPDNASGTLCAKLAGDTEQIHHMWGTSLGTNCQALVTLATGLAIAFATNWNLALVTSTIIPCVVLFGIMNMKMMQGFAKHEQFSAAGQTVTESISNIRTVYAFNLQTQQKKRYEKILDDASSSIVAKANFSGFFFGFGQFVLFAGFALSFWYGAELIKKGETDFQKVVRVSMAILLSGMGVGEVYGLAGDTAGAAEAAKSVFKLVDREPKIDARSEEGTPLSQQIEGRGNLEEVTFRYPTRPTARVLHKLTLEVPAGKHTALVGETGCGKSTVISMLMRFYDPLSGKVLIDGIDVKDLNLMGWRNRIGLVSQEPILFDDTVKNNIKYGKPDATDEEVHSAATKAHIHDVIMDLPQQYETNVGPKGSQLSGGQKQRIAIARSIIRHPAVLFLDEATSALDGRSEGEVQTALDSIMHTEHMTVVTVAHRLPTIQNADCIVVLRAGEILEQGTHTQLYAMPDGEYRRLYDQYHGLKSSSHAAPPAKAAMPTNETIMGLDYAKDPYV